MEFEDFEWHDAVINSIVLDRTNPGIKDTILFDMEWPDGKKSKIIFEDVRLAKMNLNFGIVACECVYSAHVGPADDIDLLNFYTRWKGLMDKVKLTCYNINTASTGSDIKILAESFKEIV